MMMRSHARIMTACLTAILAVGGAQAASAMDMDHMSAHANHATSAASQPTKSTAKVTASTRAYEAAMATMHQHMNAPLSGNADVDFVRGMIPHHQGAADMASILFRHGTDPDLNALAKDIWGAQTQEIAWMKCWLAEHKGT